MHSIDLIDDDAQAVLPFTGWVDPMRAVPRWYRADGTLGWTGPRIAAATCIKRHMAVNGGNNTQRSPLDDLYEFGVYTGGGFREWLRQGTREEAADVSSRFDL